jgi:hypothetical protein
MFITNRIVHRLSLKKRFMRPDLSIDAGFGMCLIGGCILLD